MAGSKMRLCELREKEVINICDGEKLGNVCDLNFEVKMSTPKTVHRPFFKSR